ncbi:hypothetical protein CANMA_003394 [Candida margitis]|uniref:uncharacterized protein n=1 Tax=Candida margitis TaxID=1775924 RepID=UPI002226F42A|nr:uncharacterized protein CANMA_003394 [Candida margitis]KAI5965532.1 hypothetical protein CANMA_003394 [Candida margitis]
MSNHPQPATSVKLVLLGEAAVGKSSLVLRFVSNDFQENKEPTIGAAFLTQKCTIGDRTIKYEIWDTAGQERFASLAPMYYRNAQAAIVVYDITKPASFVKARHWVKELHEQASKDITIALVGNKYDLVEDEPEDGDTEGEQELLRKVSKEEGQALADEEGLLFFETSAKTSYNVNEVFVGIGEKIPDNSKQGSNGPANNAELASGVNASFQPVHLCTIVAKLKRSNPRKKKRNFCGDSRAQMFGRITRYIFTPSTVATRTMSTLRVAYIPEHFSTPLFFAQQQGYYAKHSLSIEFVKVPEGSGRLINLLNNNEVDVAIGLTEAFVADIAKGNDKIKLLDTYVRSPLLWAVSTGSNRNEITKVQDLRSFGKIGISRLGSGSYIMSFVLAHQMGFDKFNEFAICSNFKNLRDSVNKIQPQGDSPAYEISDAFMWEYFTSKKYYDSGEIKQIGEIYTPWPSWVITASTKAVAAKQQDIHNFISAVNQGTAYFNQHIDEAVDYIASNLDYSAEDAKQWTKTVQFNDKVGEVALDWDKIVVKTTNVLKDAGVLQDSDDVVSKRLDEHVYKTNI